MELRRNTYLRDTLDVIDTRVFASDREDTSTLDEKCNLLRENGFACGYELGRAWYVVKDSHTIMLYATSGEVYENLHNCTIYNANRPARPAAIVHFCDVIARNEGE